MVLINWSATAGSGALGLKGRCTKLMPAALAAAASASISAPGSVGSLKLMMDANPIFLIPATEPGVIAPTQATVVSTREKFVIPGTVDFLTWDCASTAETPSVTTAR